MSTKKIVLLFAFVGILFMASGQDTPESFYRSEKLRITSKILNSERLLYVYLPSGYEADTLMSYPVFYVSDAPLQSNLYMDLIQLHGMNRSLPECIVVGLSSDGRNHNLSPDEGAGKYLLFIKNEVIPYIETKYRTNPFRVLTGHSLGGDFIIYAMLKEPLLFNAYFAGSPGPVETLLRKLNDIPFNMKGEDYRFFYTSIGSNDLTDTVEFRQLKTGLREKVGNHITCHFAIHEGEDHFSNIVVSDQEGIETLFSNWPFRLPDHLDIPVSKALKAHYDQLEKMFGFRPRIGEWEVIYPLMDQLARRGDFTNAIDILRYCITLYPESDQAYAFLAKAYFDTGQKESGIECLKKSLDLNPENPFALRMKHLIDNEQ